MTRSHDAATADLAQIVPSAVGGIDPAVGRGALGRIAEIPAPLHRLTLPSSLSRLRTSSSSPLGKEAQGRPLPEIGGKGLFTAELEAALLTGEIYLAVHSLKDLPVAVAGKTGISQYGGEGKTHGWFISFAPYENPEIALVILAEGDGDGHTLGIPVTRAVYEEYFKDKEKSE